MSNVKTLEKHYFNEARSWDDERVAQLTRSEKRAWRVAMGAGLITIAAVFAVAGLAPLKTVEPFVVEVDNVSGIVEVASGLSDKDNRDYDEVIDDYFISKYLRLRERHIFETRLSDRHAVGLMSVEKVRLQYAQYTDPRKHKKAPMNVYGETAQVHIDIKNVSPIGKDIVQVRFKKTIDRAGLRAKPTHWIATIGYQYNNARMKPEDRRISPLGFQVTQYRIDPETIGGNP